MNLSLIIPVYNEEENLPLLYDAIRSGLNPSQRYLGSDLCR